jgi:glutathione-regulated potassium-efflux system ancillary protein KefC
VGYLVAGFTCTHSGQQATPMVNTLSDLGVTLLLFTIGLKLKLKSLAEPQVWGVASLHMIAFIGVLVPALLLRWERSACPIWTRSITARP